jgi:hypothetical protein
MTMPFENPVYMSLKESIAPFSYITDVDSPTPWSVHEITTPGTTQLRKLRWYFEVAVSPKGGKHIGNVRLKPAIKDHAWDAELERLASIYEKITLGISFGATFKDDLVVYLSP